MAAISAGWTAFRKDPEAEFRDLTREQRADLYLQAWAYYRSQMFSTRNGEDWGYYFEIRSLYKRTRLIYNPVPSLVHFYVDNIWQPLEDEKFPGLVTPIDGEVDEKLWKAVAQLDQWGMFRAEAQKIKRYAAATGNVMVEITDDMIRQKITHKTVWPGYVRDLELNETGDVQSYILEYDVFDRGLEQTYRYRKEVNKDEFRYFRDDQPWTPPGKSGPVERNVYGFTPAVWIRHTDDGSDFGLPACNNFDKVDNVNSLASHIDDFIHRDIESPKLLGAAGDIEPIIGAYRDKAGQLHPQDPRLNWVVLKADTAKGPVSVHDLSGILKLAEASPELERELASFEKEYPELQAETIMRENAQLSGAALERMLGPAQNRLDGVQPGYNQQLIKLRQMQISIGGFRVNGGGWSNITDQQRKFQPFSLNSYVRGELDFELKNSQLVHETESELEDVRLKKVQRASATMDIGADELEAFKIAGYSEEDAQEIIRRAREAAVEQNDEADNLLTAGDRAIQNARMLPNGRQPIQLGNGR